MKNKNRNFLLNLIIVALISYSLIILGLKVISAAPFSARNAFMLLGFCIILGAMSSLLYWLNLKYAYYLFNAGLLIGLLVMIWTFFKNLDGWEDLAALASLFVFILAGLSTGLTVQLGFYLYRRLQRKTPDHK